MHNSSSNTTGIRLTIRTIKTVNSTTRCVEWRSSQIVLITRPSKERLIAFAAQGVRRNSRLPLSGSQAAGRMSSIKM